jgi:heme/copper-type cytochrome/quinol oxidase subunit 2
MVALASFAMAERIRGLLGGPASVLLVLVMLAGCLFLWVGVPLGWLWIGSQVQSSASLGAALAVTMAGVVVTILLLVTVLSWINGWHARLQESRHGQLPPNSALEVIFVASAGVAVVGFAFWFFGFAGASPVPLNIGF